MAAPRGERTKTLLTLVFVFTGMVWLAFGWMSCTGLRPTSRRNVSGVRAATPADVKNTRNAALVLTGVSAVILLLTRERDKTL